VAQLAEKASEVHVLMNNCYSDYAQVNAQFADLLPAVDPPGQWPPPQDHPSKTS